MMENNYQGKYFSFFNILSNQLQIVKFKDKEDDFYSANTVWDSRVISNLQFEIYFDKKMILQKELEPFSERVEILFLENSYYSGEKINFLIVNKEFGSFDLSFIVFDGKKNICYYNEAGIAQTDQYRSFQFCLEDPGGYRVYFYINNKFQYYFNIRIRERCLSKYAVELKEEKARIGFKLIPDDYKGSMKVKYWNLNNYRENYDNVPVESEEYLEELYVPINELFKKNIKENEFQKFLRIRLGDQKYNAMGMMKIIDTLKIMNTKEEVKFMENLFSEDRDLALAIMEIVFDFDILFLTPEPEAREILSLVDTHTLVAALKGETKNRIEQIKQCISGKRWEKISSLSGKIETIEMTKTDIARKKIGTIIRSYFQKKMGIPFVFAKEKKSRRKIRSFDLEPGGDMLLPGMPHNGNYAVELVLRKQSVVSFIHKETEGEDEYKFYSRTIYSTGNFFEITNIDEKYIYLKFNKKIKNGMVITGRDDMAEKPRFTEFSRVYPDEIILISRPEMRLFRMIIGVVNNDKEAPIDEADLIINLYKQDNNRVFIPDSIMSNENFPVKVMDETNNLFYIMQKDIPVSIIMNRYQDFLEVDKKEDVELSSDQSNELYVLEIKDTDSFRNYIRNGFNSVSLFFKDGKHLKLQQGGLFTFVPVIARKIYNTLHFYNLTENPFSLQIFLDDQDVFNERVEEKYYAFTDEGLKRGKKVKLHIKSSTGDYVYHFLPHAETGKIDLRKKYELKEEDHDKILKFLHRLKDRHIIYLIAELKIYFFKNKKTPLRMLMNVSEIVLNKIKKQYFTGRYFIYEPGSEFNTLDIVDILLHLKEIYKAGFIKLDRMIETTFTHIKKIKFKDKRLQDYTKPKKFKLF